MVDTILLTGSSGVVGTETALRLVDAGHDVRCLDLTPNRFRDDIDALTTEVDLLDAGALASAAPGRFDTLIHLAANARVPDSVADPSVAMGNFVSTFNVLELARSRGCRKVVFSSSKDVYGNLAGTCGEADLDLDQTSSPYSATKIGCEALLKSYRNCYGIDHVIFRISNVYGRYSADNRVIPIFIDRASKNEPLFIKGREKRFDFVHIDDVADALYLTVENFDKVRNGTYNLSSGESTALIDLAELIVTKCGSSSRIEIAEAEPGDVVASALDIGRLTNDLGFRPKIVINDGIDSEIVWYEGESV